jgi:putative flippase GtrA
MVAKVLARTLRHGSVAQLIRFGVSTGLSAAVTLGVPVLLHEALKVDQKVAVAISQSSALLINFLMIRVFVFRSQRAARRDLAYYVGSAVAFRGLEYLLFLALFTFGRLFYLTALVLTLGASTLLKFVWYRFLFAERPEPVV